jgi:SAM-dependent methyltransferase
MSSSYDQQLAELAAVHETCGRAADTFLERHQADLDAYRSQISAGIDGALERLRKDADQLSGGNRMVRKLIDEAAKYVSWMQWSLWDLPAFAVAIKPDPDAFRRQVTACGMVYIAIRVFDDLIDQHYWYKGRRQTLLGEMAAIDPRPQRAVALNSLAGLLLCFEGLERLVGDGQPAPSGTLRTLVGSIRGAVVGAVMELSDADDWPPGDYQRLVQRKNVDYWRGLYAAVDPELDSPLYPFLAQYYELAQYLNDVGDHGADLAAGQPNLLTSHRVAAGDGQAGCPALDDPAAGPVPRSVEVLLAGSYLSLAGMATRLPGLERAVAQLKLRESLTIAYGLGLFRGAQAEQPPRHRDPAPRCYWYSELRDVIEQAGPEPLEHVRCGVCQTQERRVLFQKQGFTFHRCLTCSHVYVSPRIGAGFQTRMLELDGLACEDHYLEIQRMYAESICHLLQARSPGARLLDIGFGRGYLMQMAQGYGFEVYGIDGSPAQVERLRPQFGERIVNLVVGRDPIPWEAMDVVVMSHILEHVWDPEAVMSEVRRRMVPGGWVYLAVPDMESMHFKLLGKRWDAVNPLAHLHYFNERSLGRLLGTCGFEQVERVRHRPVEDAVAPRWMRLMRQLGGSESSELVLLARAPGEPAG